MKVSSPHRQWEITPDKVEAAIQRIVEVARPRKIILFGSYLRNKIHAHSDVDFLVIAGDDIENPRKESVRIRKALRGISMPMDIIVVPETTWSQFKDQPGMIYREAAREGPHTLASLFHAARTRDALDAIAEAKGFARPGDVAVAVFDGEKFDARNGKTLEDGRTIRMSRPACRGPMRRRPPSVSRPTKKAACCATGCGRPIRSTPRLSTSCGNAGRR